MCGLRIFAIGRNQFTNSPNLTSIFRNLYMQIVVDIILIANVSGFGGLRCQWDSTRLHKSSFQQRHRRTPGKIMPASSHCPARRQQGTPNVIRVLRGICGAICEIEPDLYQVWQWCTKTHYCTDIVTQNFFWSKSTLICLDIVSFVTNCLLWHRWGMAKCYKNRFVTISEHFAVFL